MCLVGGSWFVLFCYDLVQVDFTHILQDYFFGTLGNYCPSPGEAILGLIQFENVVLPV